jgi:hypothetical protein
VGTVVTLKGLKGHKPDAEYLRDGKWRPIGLGSQLRPHDKIRTDAHTVMAVELDLGGRVGVRESSRVEILGDRSVHGEGTGRSRLTKGGMWAKCGQMKESLEIQTSGGVMGIKG